METGIPHTPAHSKSLSSQGVQSSLLSEQAINGGQAALLTCHLLTLWQLTQLRQALHIPCSQAKEGP